MGILAQGTFYIMSVLLGLSDLCSNLVSVLFQWGDLGLTTTHHTLPKPQIPYLKNEDSKFLLQGYCD